MNTTTTPGVLASLDQAKAALSQNATFPADVALALTAVAEARATVAEMIEVIKQVDACIDGFRINVKLPPELQRRIAALARGAA